MLPLPLAVDWSRFLDPAFVLPLVTPLVVGLLAFAAQPGSRQRAKHEADILKQLREVENPNSQVTGAIADLEYVLSNRIKGWAQSVLYRPPLVPAVCLALVLLGGALGTLTLFGPPGWRGLSVESRFSLAVLVSTMAVLTFTALLWRPRRRRR